MGQRICCVSSSEGQLLKQSSKVSKNQAQTQHSQGLDPESIVIVPKQTSSYLQQQDTFNKEKKDEYLEDQILREKKSAKIEVNSKGRVKNEYSKTFESFDNSSTSLKSSNNIERNSLQELRSTFTFNRTHYLSQQENDKQENKECNYQQQWRVPKMKSEYHEKMDSYLFVKCSSSFTSHFYFNKVKKINQELESIIQEEITNYKLSQNDSIGASSYLGGAYLFQDSQSPQLFKLIIAANPQTSYAFGIYIFDVFLPEDFPSQPPRVRLCLSEQNEILDQECTYRIFPRVKEEGKIFLDILGVFVGREKENTQINKRKSVFSDLIEEICQELFNDNLMVQARIMEGESQILNSNNNDSNINLDSYGSGYQNVIQYINLTVGIQSVIQRVLNSKYSKEIEQLIVNHFLIVETNIYKIIHTWIKNQPNETPLYSGLVSQHNPQIADLLQKKGYNKLMEDKFKLIKSIFCSLKAKQNAII